MAEFQEVAKQKRRMCKMYDNNGCNGCPLSNGDCRVINVRYTDVNDVQRVENVIMSWAAEHPEPIYPTWFEYLYAINNPDYFDLTEFYTWMRHTPIPAGIAEKLGITPKENN